MKVRLKTPEEIDKMRSAGKVLASLFVELARRIKPGVTAYELDQFAEEYIRSFGAEPAFKGYRVGSFVYPATLCVSVDDEIVHGIPTKDKVLKEGMIVGIDVGARLDGYYSDAARTYAVGQVSAKKKALMRVTREALELAIATARPGITIQELGARIQAFVERHNFSVVRDYCGHGIGRDLHEKPEVPNHGYISIDGAIKIMPNMTLAIEPMVNMGTYMTRVKNDHWTVVTADGKPSAHFEDTIAILEDKNIVLTR